MLQVIDQEIIDVDIDENSIMSTEGMDGKNYKGKVIYFVYEICILTSCVLFFYYLVFYIPFHFYILIQLFNLFFLIMFPGSYYDQFLSN